jgi:hypothetical protein
MTWPAKFERVVAVDAGVEFLAVGEPAGVMHGNGLPGGGGGAVADDEFFDDEFAHGFSPWSVKFAMGRM